MNKYFNDMESLTFVMYHDPERIGYQFKAYPGFVNKKYMSRDFVDDTGIINALVIDEYKKYLFYTSSLADELIETLQSTGPVATFHYLEQSLYTGYEERKEVYTTWKVYKLCSSVDYPTYEIQQAAQEIFASVYDDIKKVEYETCNSLSSLAKNVAKGLLMRQQLLLNNL